MIPWLAILLTFSFISLGYANPATPEAAIDEALSKPMVIENEKTEKLSPTVKKPVKAKPVLKKATAKKAVAGVAVKKAVQPKQEAPIPRPVEPIEKPITVENPNLL